MTARQILSDITAWSVGRQAAAAGKLVRVQNGLLGSSDTRTVICPVPSSTNFPPCFQEAGRQEGGFPHGRGISCNIYGAAAQAPLVSSPKAQGKNLLEMCAKWVG